MNFFKRIVFGIIIFAVVLIPAKLISRLSFITPPDWLPRSELIQILILIFSLILISVFSRGNWRNYGFKTISVKSVFRPILTVIVTLIVLQVIFAVNMKLTGAKAEHPGTAGMSLFQLFIYVFIFASIAEEIFFRSLIQTILAPLKIIHLTIFKIKLSLPVIMSAFLFAFAHLGLLLAGAGVIFTMNIVLMAFILGLIAGYYREKTGSIIPAIAAHMTFNFIGGILPLAIMQLLSQ